MAKFLKKSILSLGALALMSQLASAHTGAGSTHGFTAGFMHPVGGLDHMLAMVAVGLFAVQRGGKALWLVPLAFVVMMGLGGVFGFNGIDLPAVELGIAASVIVLGLAIAFQVKLPVMLAMGLVGFFALFHGYAHGAEMPMEVSALAYVAGFMMATGLLHGAGMVSGFSLQKLLQARMGRGLIGGAMATAGAGLLAGVL